MIHLNKIISIFQSLTTMVATKIIVGLIVILDGVIQQKEAGGTVVGFRAKTIKSAAPRGFVVDHAREHVDDNKKFSIFIPHQTMEM